MTTERSWRTILPPIFAACCHSGDGRYHLSTPFIEGGFVCATDGRICVRMLKPDGLELPEPKAPVPPVGSVMDGAFGPGVPCPDPGPTAPDEPCKACKGTKMCSDPECRCGGDCEECDGSGIERKPAWSVLVIEGQANLGDGLLRILFVNGATLYPPLRKRLDPWKFTIGDNIEGRVMPRSH